jgi:mannose-6-phosphate isomerase class I
MLTPGFRKTSQYLMPAVEEHAPLGSYNLYPVFEIGEGSVFRKVESLANAISGRAAIIIDGYTGVFFDYLKSQLEEEFRKSGTGYSWISASFFMKSPEEIEELKILSCGAGDPLFGTKTTLSISDIFDLDAVEQFRKNPPEVPFIIIGPGASFVFPDGFHVWCDLPKNEIQYRSRAGSVTNLGERYPTDPREMYKRYYFFDWVILNRHKEKCSRIIDILVDTQRPDDITWMYGSVFREKISELSASAFRVRPWFEPGSWGGTWLKSKIKGLPQDVPNYAWSFELITPENGIIFSSSGLMFEFSFDFLMYLEGRSVLGSSFERFGTEFPIRFDYLDTVEGGNLSVQCHPREDYIKTEFGENFAQDETYYIAHSAEDSGVYLGLTENCDPKLFFNELKESSIAGTSVDIRSYVQFHRSEKNDLFVIPRGTVHGSGANNLVLEISSTPYIFTFKMYDWLRPDLDGKPRQLNIARAEENLNPSYRGELIRNSFISRPEYVLKDEDREIERLSTHDSMFFEVMRYRFSKEVVIRTDGKCLVLNLIEGETVLAETGNGRKLTVNCSETFVIPSAAVSARLINLSDKQATIVAASVK